jgi:hypothetical protein
MAVRSWIVLLAVLLIESATGSTPRPLAAQDLPVPVAVQIPILVKVLNFDRRLPERAGGKLVIGVLFQSRYRTSANVAEEVCRGMKNLPASTLGVLEAMERSCVPVDLDETRDLSAALKVHRVRVLYVSPLRAYPVETIFAATRMERITTLTGVPRYVEDGLAIGLDMKRERPEIVVNLAASRAEGADLTAQLLKLARVVGEEVGGR